jgi:23S rRNA pseudouridine1911/1915/1917 synthase
MEHRQYVIPPAAAGERLDAFLARVSGLSRARVQRLIEDGLVLVDGRPEKPRHRATPDQRIELQIPDPTPLRLTPEHIPLDILHEDADLIVLNKPAGLVVHPGAGRMSGTLVHALLAHCERLPGIGGVERPGIVHRLDRDTSGVLVIAKSDAAHQALSQQFKARQVQKRYLALVHGQMAEPAGRIEAPIGRRAHDRKRMGVRREGGREARTRFRVLRRLPGLTLVELDLETGRTHQIRVHLAHIHHPVVGDQVYGGRRERRQAAGQEDWAPRQMLHAWRLAFRHPVTGLWLEFIAPLPADFRQAAGVTEEMLRQWIGESVHWWSGGEQAEGPGAGDQGLGDGG